MESHLHSKYERPSEHSLNPSQAAEYIEATDIVLDAVINEPQKVAVLGTFLANPDRPLSYTEVTSEYVRRLTGRWTGSAYRDKQEVVESA